MRINVNSKKKRLLITALIILLVVVLIIIGVPNFNKKDSRFADIRIYLSPSNQYSNYYATGNTTEMEQCDKIAEKTAEFLKNMGFTVMVGQSGDSIESRCVESEEFGADLHIPIHTNALDGTYTGGTHVYVYSETEKAVGSYFLETLGAISPGEDDRLQSNPSLYEIYTPVATSVYLECEFHDTQEGAEWIENNTNKIAKAIADGVYNYYSDKLSE